MAVEAGDLAIDPRDGSFDDVGDEVGENLADVTEGDAGSVAGLDFAEFGRGAAGEEVAD